MALGVNPITGLPDLIGSGGAAPTTPGGADGSVQYNNGGAFGGFGTFDDGTDLLTLPDALQVPGLLQVGAGFQVTGDSDITGLLTVVDLTVSDDVQIASDLNVDGETTVDGLGIDGTAGFAGEVNFTGVNQVTLEAAANFLFSGRLRLNTATMTLADGDNDAVTSPVAPVQIISGPTNPFAIRGIVATAANNGQFLILINNTGQAMTLTHEAGGAAGNQLRTSTGADIVTTGNGYALVWRDTDAAVWTVIATSL